MLISYQILYHLYTGCSCLFTVHKKKGGPEGVEWKLAFGQILTEKMRFWSLAMGPWDWDLVTGNGNQRQNIIEYIIRFCKIVK